MSSRIQQFHIKKGVRAYLRGEVVIIQGVTGLDSVIVRAVENGKSEEVKIRELVPVEITLEVDPIAVSENKRSKEALEKLNEVAQQKVEIIKPLLNMAKRTRKAVEERAAEFRRGASTLYEWIAEYGQEREIENLYSKLRSDAGTTRNPSATEDIIQTHLNGLRPEDKCLAKIWEDIKYKIDAALSCATANPADDTGQLTESIDSAVQPKGASLEYVHPSLGTVRNRYYNIPKREHEARLHGVQAAEQIYEPALGTIPNADFPLQTVQIDHVRLDITLVDKNRKPIRRPWLTIEIDVCSRVVPSFYLSHDTPGVMSTGLCIARGIFPKDKWLAELGSDVQYPIWGKPTILHGDNAFRLGMLRKACNEHGFDIIWRPVKKPRFGGHIERLARTLGEDVHYLPGTTFSNPDERGDYDSEGKAVFTLEEFERWFVELVGKYHATKHSALGMSPMERYKLGVLKANGKFAATGLQPQIVDVASQRRLRLDLLPFEMRTIQRDGVAIGKVKYFHDILRPWVNATDPENPKCKRLFKFTTFPPLVNSKYFFDPDQEDYFEIPARNLAFPPISAWELREIKKEAKAEGIPKAQIDEQFIIRRAEKKMRDIEAEATANTKAARAQAASRLARANIPKPPQSERPQTQFEMDATYTPAKRFTDKDR